MLVLVGAYAFDIVASGGHGPIVVALDIGVIGLAILAWWRLGRWGRRHPELVVWIVASGVTFSLAATAIAVPDLAIQSAGYLLVLPGLAALLLPWRASTHFAWLVVFLVFATGYFVLVRSDELPADSRIDLASVLAVAAGASLAGKYIIERGQIRTFAQMERIRTLRREADALGVIAQGFEQRAIHDPLTGLANRTLLGDRLAQALAQRGTTVAVVMLDLDGFKAINDRLGHAAGDDVLLGVAARFTSVLRSGDTLARLGGDEFAVVAPGVRNAAVACAIAKRLLGSLRAPVPLASSRGRGLVGEVAVHASAGIALVAAGACEAQELVHRADVALYRAKEKGNNQWLLFEAPMDTEVA